jgi:predicted GIY-YIG superfamily endonuclease
LYVGVTNDLVRRVYQHKRKTLPGFTVRYAIETRLVRSYDDTVTAIAREKQLKKVAARMEDSFDRTGKSRLARSLSGYLHLRNRRDGFRARRFASPRNDVPVARPNPVTKLSHSGLTASPHPE